MRLSLSDDSPLRHPRRAIPGRARGGLRGASAAAVAAVAASAASAAALLGAAGCSGPDAAAVAPANAATATAAEVEVDAEVEVPAEPTHPELRAALLDLRQRDQAARGAMVEAMKAGTPTPGGGFRFGPGGAAALEAVSAIDAESTAFLRTMTAEHGWPTFDMVGRDGAAAAWLLAQHADADPAFQADVLARLEPLVARGQAEPQHLALLTDRVRQAQGRPQLYGTQFTTDDAGVNRPAPIEDAARVDERRAAMGLPPLVEYAKRIEESYGEPASPVPMPGDEG